VHTGVCFGAPVPNVCDRYSTHIRTRVREGHR
jgi:hypothetical protein